MPEVVHIDMPSMELNRERDREIKTINMRKQIWW
jgi:hypothetical protein